MDHPLVINGFSSIKELALSVYESKCLSLFYENLASSLIFQAGKDLIKGYKKLGLLGYLTGSSIFLASDGKLRENKIINNYDLRGLAWACGFMRYDAINELINELLKHDNNRALLNASHYLSEMWRISKPHMAKIDEN